MQQTLAREEKKTIEAGMIMSQLKTIQPHIRGAFLLPVSLQSGWAKLDQPEDRQIVRNAAVETTNRRVLPERW